MITHCHQDRHAIFSIINILGASGLMLLASCNPPAGDTIHHSASDVAAPKESHVQGGICQEHMVPEGNCGICNPDKIATLKPGESLQLRLASGTSADMAGVKTAKPSEDVMADGIGCYAEFGFNLNQFAQITAPVAGVIAEVTADLGSMVRYQETVARIWSAQIAETVAKAALTHQTLERERKLRSQMVTSEKDLQEAEAAHRALCQGLRTLGFSETQIDELSRKPQEPVMLNARAPFAGKITNRTAVRGAFVEAGTPLFAIADCSVMWADLAVAEAEVSRLVVGQHVDLTVDSLPERSFIGRVTWISAELDATTRMVRARAEVPNPDGLIKARMFAKARIRTASSANALMVPLAAIQRVDGKPLLFVKAGADLFDARAVRLGARVGDRWIITEGLIASDEVVTEHAFALKSQLLIERLGAGCADD